MRILLLGEASNLHWTLAEGLRQFGHEVTVISDGSGWMNNERDINLYRKSYGVMDSLAFYAHLFYNLKNLTDYDIVQIKNPMFFDLKASRNLSLFKFLKRHNKKVFLGAFGTDYYWVKTCLDRKTFRYSDFFTGDTPNDIPQNRPAINEWVLGNKRDVNRQIAEECDGIIACLYEYYVSYKPEFADKLTYIPLPINLSRHPLRSHQDSVEKVNFFIGIQKLRNQLKGTDILYDVLKKVNTRYPSDSVITKAESVPNAIYNQMMDTSDVLIDQLYSYTPAMNGLAAMAKGLVLVSGGEPEMYDQLHENENYPIINVIPDREDIYNKLEWLILNRTSIPEMSTRSRAFVEKHHDHIKVARQYLDFWSSR